jgi:hypothetical protein
VNANPTEPLSEHPASGHIAVTPTSSTRRFPPRTGWNDGPSVRNLLGISILAAGVGAAATSPTTDVTPRSREVPQDLGHIIVTGISQIWHVTRVKVWGRTWWANAHNTERR